LQPASDFDLIHGALSVLDLHPHRVLAAGLDPEQSTVALCRGCNGTTNENNIVQNPDLDRSIDGGTRLQLGGRSSSKLHFDDHKAIHCGLIEPLDILLFTMPARVSTDTGMPGITRFNSALAELEFNGPGGRTIATAF
jgi:hypothetical protein